MNMMGEKGGLGSRSKGARGGPDLLLLSPIGAADSPSPIHLHPTPPPLCIRAILHPVQLVYQSKHHVHEFRNVDSGKKRGPEANDG